MLRDQGVAGSNPSKESDVKGAPIAVPDLHLLGVGRLVRVLGSGLSRQSVTRIRLLEVLCGANSGSLRCRYDGTSSAKHPGTSVKEYHPSNRASCGHCFTRYFAGA